MPFLCVWMCIKMLSCQQAYKGVVMTWNKPSCAGWRNCSQ